MWHCLAAEQVLAEVGSSTAGLSATEAARRLAEFGPNELKEAKPISPWAILLVQFKNLIIWILIAAGVISGLLGELVDSIAILAIVILNAVIGFYQEFKAKSPSRRLSDAELRNRVPAVDVYTRVTAEHKLRIACAWKANGAVVAMTGDGVNDAPAIKGADIGIAMGRSGTEVTKQASDMIVTDDNVASIVAAVEDGRGIYDNIRKTLQYLLAGNTGELLLMTICVVLGLPAPLVPIHLLWINHRHRWPTRALSGHRPH